MRLNTTTITTILIALVLVGAVAPVSAAAQDESDDDDGGVLESVGNWLSDAKEAASGAIDRAGYWLSNIGSSDDETTASDSADALDEFATDHEDELVAYANAQAPENVTKTNYDVVRLDLQAGGEETTVYAVSDVKDDEVQSFEIVEKTDRSVDFTLTFDEYATKELPEDLEHVRTNYVEPGEEPRSLRAYIVGKYWNGDFDSEDSHVRITGGDA